MALLEAYRDASATVLGTLGGHKTVKVRKLHTLTAKATGAGVSSLLVKGAHAAGAAAVTLDAAVVLQERDKPGRLPKGCKFTIAGDATVYETTADRDVVSNELAVVPITPVLAAPAADNAVVTLTQPYGEHTYTAFRGKSQELLEERDTGEVAITRRPYRLAAKGATADPEEGNILVDGAASFGIDAVHPVSAGGGSVNWLVEVGEAA